MAWTLWSCVERKRLKEGGIEREKVDKMSSILKYHGLKMQQENYVKRLDGVKIYSQLLEVRRTLAKQK
ncbi:hypothetical protein M514_11678, partial [Trichuris suis]